MITPEAALDQVLAEASELPPRSIPAKDALGLKLAQDVPADRDYPPFNRAAMDGFAVSLQDAGSTVRIAGVVAAGDEPEVIQKPGTCIEIMTGAPCPEGTEAVVQYELVETKGDTVLLPDSIKPGQNIALAGSECPKNYAPLRSGDIISTVGLAVLSSFGVYEILVYPRPSVAILTTGEELVRAGELPGRTQIRDCNGPMLTAMAAEIGLTDIRSGSVGDDREDIQGALERALLADMVVLTGGVSMGKYDFVPEVLKDLGMKTVFHQVAQKPGKPLLFAKRDTTLLFGLPGNPLSSHLCFHRYVAPAARAMGGLPLRRQQFFGRLDENVPGAGRRSFFQLVEVSGPHDEKASDLIPLIGKGSADIYAPVAADAYIIVPAGEKGLSAGSMVQFEYIGNGPWTS